jgi:hypothetical protein
MDDQIELTARQKVEWIARKWAWACKDAPPESQFDLLITEIEKAICGGDSYFTIAPNKTFTGRDVLDLLLERADAAKKKRTSQRIRPLLSSLRRSAAYPTSQPATHE